MKAVMSNRVRMLLDDPEKRKDLLEGLNFLHNSKQVKANIKIGEGQYELKSLSAWGEKNKHK